MSRTNPPLSKDKPIGLRLPEDVRVRTWQYAEEESRPASNFVRLMFLRGLAEYERERAAKHAPAH